MSSPVPSLYSRSCRRIPSLPLLASSPLALSESLSFRNLTSSKGFPHFDLPVLVFFVFPDIFYVIYLFVSSERPVSLSSSWPPLSACLSFFHASSLDRLSSSHVSRLARLSLSHDSLFASLSLPCLTFHPGCVSAVTMSFVSLSCSPCLTFLPGCVSAVDVSFLCLSHPSHVSPVSPFLAAVSLRSPCLSFPSHVFPVSPFVSAAVSAVAGSRLDWTETVDWAGPSRSRGSGPRGNPAGDAPPVGRDSKWRQLPSLLP